MKLNTYFFEALKARLENILRSLSGNRKSQITWGGTIATDIVNKVVLTPRAEIVPGTPASLAELLVFYKACVAHEGAHIKYTSKKDWKEACSRGPAFQHLTNIIEDGRIESAISRDLPGAGRWLRFANNYVIRHRAAWGEGVTAFLIGLAAYSVAGQIPDVDPETKRLIKLAAPWVDIGKASPDTKGVLTCVEEILKIPEIEELFRRETSPPPKDERASGRPQKSKPDQKTKDREEKAREVLKKRAEKSDPKEDPKEESEEKSGSEDAEDKSEENPKRKSGDKHKDDSEKEESAGDSKEEDPPEDREDSGNSDDSGHEEESSDEVSDDTNIGNSEEISDDPVGDSSSNDSHDDKDSSGKSEGQSDVPDKEESPSDSGKSSDTEEDSLGKDNDEGKENSFEDSPGAGSGNLDDTPDDFLEDDYFEPQDEEDFENLLESSEDEVLSITKDAENLERDDKEIDLTEGVSTEQLHTDVYFEQEKLRPRPTEYQALKSVNQPIIKGLVNEIRVALESRKAYDLRGLNRGRLHSGSLWKLAVQDPGVFAKRHIPGDIPELAAYILVDLSGSMSSPASGRKRIDHAKNAACVLSETCRELKIPHAITGFREVSQTVVHYPVVAYDDFDSVGIASFYEDGCNRDGYSIRVATNELSTRPEPRKILFVLSDGLPAATGRYYGPNAWQDVQKAVLEARKKGIRVISLKFGDINNESEFKFMYDTPVFVHDTAMLPKTLGSVFKRVLLD